jgi:aminotransferase
MSDAELDAVRAVFQAGWLGPGPRLDEFRSAFARHLGVPAGELLSVGTCTEGLFQAIAALDLSPGDSVVLPTVSFVGAANAVLAAGAEPVFCDVDPRTLNPRVEHIEAALTPRTRAVIVLHFGGFPGWIDGIARLAHERGIVLVEDAACAVGSSLHGRMCGTFGDIGVWSFDAMKILATGDGGMLRASDSAVAERVRRHTYVGIQAAGMAMARNDARPWWEVDPSLPGRHSRMNDLTASIGLVQLGRLPALLARRAEIATRYSGALRELDWLTLPPDPAVGSTVGWYFYWVQTAPGTRDALARYLLERGVYTTFRYWPLHRTRLYADARPFPGADQGADTTLLLPLHASLTDADVEAVITAVCGFRQRESAPT